MAPDSKQSSSSKKAKSRLEDMDWADVTDPEERRRIQNRLAQRKFREKARVSKEKTERDSHNRKHAANSYRIPSPSDLGHEQEISGLPWGSFNIRHVVSKGHEAESRRSSGRGTYVDNDGFTSGRYSPYGYPWDQTASYGSSGGDDIHYDDNYIYGPSGPSQ